MIYERYQAGFKNLPVSMNSFDSVNSEPNYWLSCMLIEPEAMCKQVRGEQDMLYIPEPGKSCPTEILETLAKYNAEGRPIWKPMHCNRSTDESVCHGERQWPCAEQRLHRRKLYGC